MDVLQLGSLDEAPPLELDPGRLAANLGALREQDAELAEGLAEIRVSGHWRPVWALDGFPTCRCEHRGERPLWLGGSAIPQRRASATLPAAPAGEANLALPGIYAGAEILRLLHLLSDSRGVYVFEPQYEVLVAVLRTLDLAAAIRSFRCIIVRPEQGAASAECGASGLERLLEAHVGLQPPGQVVALPYADAGRTQPVVSLCESLSREVQAKRTAKLSLLQDPARECEASRSPSDEATERRGHGAPTGSTDEAATTTHSQQGPALLIAACRSDSRIQHAASALLDAAERLQWPVRCARIRDPRDVHPLHHAHQIAGFTPDLVIGVGHDPGVLPLSLSGRICQWHVGRVFSLGRESAVGPSDPSMASWPRTRVRDSAIHLAATPTIASDLKRCGVADSQIRLFLHAVRSDLPEPTPRGPTAERIVILADLPDARAGACGVHHSTHRQLWDALHRIASAGWDRAANNEARTCLRDAERATGLRIGEATLRAQMLRLIEHVLIPAVVLQRILRALRELPYELCAVGAGWDREESVRTLSSGPHELAEEEWSKRPLVAIFAGATDLLSPGLLEAGARGWPLLIHAPDRRSTGAALAGVLRPDGHFLSFGGQADLLRILQDNSRNDDTIRRRCQRTIEHLREEHTWEQRLRTVAQDLLGPARA